MPALPPSLEVDPVLAALVHVAAFLELSGDDAVDTDSAVEATEFVAHYLQQLPSDRGASLRQQLGRVVEYAREQGWGEDAVEFLAGFAENFGLGEEG